ncbi:MAG TPA: glycosyltransferase [Candidatus Binatia bacterium]|jgi:SAM-dependent methyltransferase
MELHQNIDKVRQTPLRERQQAACKLSDRLARERHKWLARNRYFYDNDRRYMQFLVPAGQRVLELGCGEGQLLRSLRPSHGVGVDLSLEMIKLARERSPEFEFHVGNAEDPESLAGLAGPFDYIILSDMIGYLEDCGGTFEALRNLCLPETRLVIAYYSRLWEPVVRLSERIGAKMPAPDQNWLSTDDTANLLWLSGFEVVRREWRQLMPKRLLGMGTVLNKVLAPLPGIRRLCLRNYLVARPVGPRRRTARQPSCSVLIPCRNERGNIENAVRRLPQFAPDLEILLVEGHSRDGTYEECLRVADAYPHKNIRTFQQPGKGKGDAARLGFAQAKGDIVMILDADLTVAPEFLPKFYRVLVEGRGEFVNGTRLVYPMSDKAMRTLNAIANRSFAMIFSYLLNQRITDTLCGTKALWREDYERIAAGRAYFDALDPFGDFDLIFGAAKLNLKIVEVPVRYSDRTYGETQISRFRDGWLLLRMVALAWRKLKVL